MLIITVFTFCFSHILLTINASSDWLSTFLSRSDEYALTFYRNKYNIKKLNYTFIIGAETK